MSRPITFLSDYGYDDEFAGVCRAVMARIAPGSRIADISHGVARHSVRDGAAMLATSLPYCEAGVHLAVVDPGVGSGRRPVAIRSGDDRVLVGPDNGLLIPAAEALGGVLAAVDLSASPFRLEPVSPTFHGRDVFAPVAARIAAGAAMAEAGEALDPGGLIRLVAPAATIAADRILARVVHVDGFGNAALDVAGHEVGGTFLETGEMVALEAGATRRTVPFGRTFADVGEGELVIYIDARGSVALAANCGDAASILGLSEDDEVALSPAS